MVFGHMMSNWTLNSNSNYLYFTLNVQRAKIPKYSQNSKIRFRAQAQNAKISVVSTPIWTVKAAFLSIFQDLSEKSAQKCCKTPENLLEIRSSHQNLEILWNFKDDFEQKCRTSVKKVKMMIFDRKSEKSTFISIDKKPSKWIRKILSESRRLFTSGSWKKLKMKTMQLF